MILRYEFRCQGGCGILYEDYGLEHEFDNSHLRLILITDRMLGANVLISCGNVRTQQSCDILRRYSYCIIRQGEKRHSFRCHTHTGHSSIRYAASQNRYSYLLFVTKIATRRSRCDCESRSAVRSMKERSHTASSPNSVELYISIHRQ